MSSSFRRSPEEEKKQRSTKPQRLHYGLYNQGSTCYLNSVLQVLFMTTEMHDRLDPGSLRTDEELRIIFMKLKKRACRTDDVIRCLDIKDVYQQSDAAECLEMILHKISPKASEVFQGQLKYTTKCSQFHTITEETNPFWVLPLSLQDTHDATYGVGKNLDRIFQITTFSGDNMVYCDKCKAKREATSECEMVESPRVLILLLKRFDFDYGTMSHVKSDCRVDVPLVLHVKNKKYQLYGMVNHTGGLRGGHYTATILSNDDKTWYEFDDAVVHKVNEQLFAKDGTHNSGTAYLIVYRASRRQRVESKERADEATPVAQQKGHKEAHKARFEATDADDGENGQNQGNPRHWWKEGSRGTQPSVSRHGYGEEGDAKGRSASSVGRGGAEEPVLLHQKRSTSHPSKRHQDTVTKVETKKQQSKKEDDDDPQQPCGWSDYMRKKRAVRISLIALAVIVGFVLIVILPIVLTN